jgi:hypothetical protein
VTDAGNFTTMGMEVRGKWFIQADQFQCQTMRFQGAENASKNTDHFLHLLA